MDALLKEIRDLLATSMAATSIKKYYVGYVPPNRVPKAYLPIICVYATPDTSTSLVSEELGLQRDKWMFSVTIEVMVNVFDKVSSSGVEADSILDAQSAVRIFVEDRESNGTPKAETVLGTLRRNIKGMNYLFNNDITVSYNQSNEENKLMMIGTVQVSFKKLTNRS